MRGILAGILAGVWIGLTGCGREVPSETTVRDYFAALPGFSSHLAITVDLGESIQQYGLDYTYAKDANDSFTLTAPEGLQGIAGTIAGEEGAAFSLQYEGMELDAVRPVREGLSPADGLFFVISALKNAQPVQSWTETLSGQSLLVLRYEDGTDIARQVWLSENGTVPVCAEIYEGTSCVMTIQITQFQAQG